MQDIDPFTPELIMRAQAGDEAALAEVLAASGPRLRAMAKRVHKEQRLGGYARPIRPHGRGQGPAHLPGRARTLLVVCPKHVRGCMIDGYASELGLSSDARKAYPRVVATYRADGSAARTRPPTAAEVAAACGVTAGLAEQIINVLLRPCQALDDIAEHTPDVIPPPAAPPSAVQFVPRHRGRRPG